MLLRVISVISLILFMLLMLSGAEVDIALYRSVLVFLILFAILYISIFLLNVVKGDDPENIKFSGGGQAESQGDS